MEDNATTPRHRKRQARHAAPSGAGSRTVWILAAVVLVAVSVTGAIWAVRPAPARASVSAPTHPQVATDPRGASTTSTLPPTTTTTEDPLRAPAAPGLVAGRVTAVGDSVMVDYEGPLQGDIPGAVVDAAVSRQWSTGESILGQLRASGQLGAVVIVALGSNGPITAADFDAMMAVVAGANRVVFVNVHVDQPWQDPNDAVLAAGVARTPGTVLVDLQAAALAHPEWFSDGTHLPIGGPVAQLLAAAIAADV